MWVCRVPCSICDAAYNWQYILELEKARRARAEKDPERICARRLCVALVDAWQETRGREG